MEQLHIHNCTTSPHSWPSTLRHLSYRDTSFCSPSSKNGTAKLCSQLVTIHELFVGVEALGSQPDLHLGEEIVVAWRQVRIVK